MIYPRQTCLIKKSLVFCLAVLLVFSICNLNQPASAGSIGDNYETLKAQYPQEVQLFLDAGVSETEIRSFIADLDTELAGRTLTEANFNNQFINAVISVYLDKDDEYKAIFDVLVDNFSGEIDTIVNEGTIPASIQGMANVLKTTLLASGSTPGSGASDGGNGSGGSGGGSTVTPTPESDPDTTSQKVLPNEQTTIKTADQQFQLTVPQGALSKETTITVKPIAAAEQLAPTAGTIKIGNLQFKLEAADITGNQVRSFNQELVFNITYKTEDIPADIQESDLKVCYWDETLKNWIAVPTTVDPANNKVTARTKHFTIYAVMAMSGFPQLNDIKGHWAEADIMKIVSMKIASGDAVGTFRPQENISREEFAKFAVLAAGLTPENDWQLNFTDAATISPWARGYVAAAVKAGIIKGYSDNTFMPGRNVSRAEIATMLVRALGEIAPSVPVLMFTDLKSIPDWAFGNIARAVDLGLINGFPDNSFQAAKEASRAEAATMIAKMISVPR
jgi:hypothetical protein